MIMIQTPIQLPSCHPRSNPLAILIYYIRLQIHKELVTEAIPGYSLKQQHKLGPTPYSPQGKSAMWAILARIFVDDRCYKETHVASSPDDFDCDVDEGVGEVGVLEVVGEYILVCPAHPFIVVIFICICGGAHRFVRRADQCHAAIVQPLSVCAEGIAIAFGEFDGVILAPFGFESVVEEARTLT
jgi:hypothetical protein